MWKLNIETELRLLYLQCAINVLTQLTGFFGQKMNFLTKIDHFPIFRGPFITALGRTWCPSHFTCSQACCQKSLQETGFVEEKG